MKNIAWLALLVTPFGFAQTDPVSFISLGIQTELSAVGQGLNQAIPMELHAAPARRAICVEAERACTKIPEFRGLKVYSRMECIDVSPRISCDISEKVTRAGDLQLTGDGSTFSVTETISGSATARGRGTIGKNIRQTVRGSARVTAEVQGGLSADWTPQVSFLLNREWVARPQVNLFGTIPITVGTEADRAIDRAELDLRQRVPGLLAGVDLRGRAADLWRRLQEPLPLSLAGTGGSLFAHIRPEAAGFSGVDFSSGQVRATTSLRARTRVTDSTRSPWTAPTELPNLSEMSATESGFSITVPATIGFDTLNALIAEAVPFKHNVGASIVDRIDVLTVNFSGSAERLFIDTQLRAYKKDAELSAFEGMARFSSRLLWNAQSQHIVLDDFKLENGLNAPLRAGFRIGQFLGLVTRSIEIPLSSAMATLRSDLTAALNRPLSESIALQGTTADVRLADLSLSGTGVLATAIATGMLDVTLSLER